MLGALLIGGVALGLVSGGIKAAARNAEYEETLKDLKKKRQDLDDTFNNTITNAAAELEEANKKLEANIADTTKARDRNASSSSKTIADQQVIAEMEMADLQVQMAEQTGSAVQGVAMSGTRLMTDGNGNVMNAQVFKTERASASATEKARAKVALDFYSNAEAARSNYLQADANIAAYQREIAYNGTVERDAEGNVIGGTGKFGRSYSSYKLEYTQQADALDEDIRYMNNEGWKLNNAGMITDVLTGGLNGYTSSYKLFG